jgi:crotonobetainyl-CoA:carnitine CoA-transferase CaiB-like acyl-CoA transferase
MSITGEPGRPPVRTGPSIVDQGAGMWAVIGILSALHRRAATGAGATVDTSLYETALSWMNSPTAGWLATGNVPGKRGSEQASLVPYKVFSASDGDIMVACGNDNLFRRLADALGHGEWLDDPRFASNPDRVRNREVVNAAVQKVIAGRTVEAWLETLEQAGVPAAPLQTVDQVARHPQTQALGMLQPVPGTDMTLMGLPLSFDGVRPTLTQGPPKLGEHSALILEGDRS